MIASHDRSYASHLLRKISALLNNEVFRSFFPEFVVTTDNASEVAISTGGVISTVSFESAPTGRGFHLLIVDDPIKADDAYKPAAHEHCATFFSESLDTRMIDRNNPRVVVIMQRFAIDDLSGRLLKTGAYKSLALPYVATARERIPYGNGMVFEREEGEYLNPTYMSQKALEEWKKGLGGAFEAQVQQNPLESNSVRIKPEWLQRISAIPEDGYIIQACDTARSISDDADYTVFLTWKFLPRKYSVLIDVVRVRVSEEELSTLAWQLAQKHQPARILVEQVDAGYVVAEELKNRFSVHCVRPYLPKKERLAACLPAFEKLQVFVLDGQPWSAAYCDELTAFPLGRYDDQVDATTLYLNWVDLHGNNPQPPLRKHQPMLATGSRTYMPNVYQVGRAITPARHWTPTHRPKR